MKIEDDPEATDLVYVQLSQLEAAPPAPATAPKCLQCTYIDRRADLIFKSKTPPRPCKGCGECPCLQTQFESVSSLPVNVQNPLRCQMALLVGAMFTAVAITSWVLENPLYLDWLAYDLIFVAGFVLNMYGIALVSSSSPNVRLQLGLLGIALGAFFAGIDNAMDTCSLFVVCCAMGFIFLIASAYMKRVASYQSSFILEEVSPVSPVKVSIVAYLLAAIVQIYVFAASGDDSAFVTRNGLIGCLIAECVLAVSLLWELSQMTRAMKKEEVPVVFGCLYVDLLGLAFTITLVLCSSMLYIVAKCVTCGRYHSHVKIGSSGSSDGDLETAIGDAVAAHTRSEGDAHVETAQRESLKTKLGDAFQKKIQGAQ